MNWQGAVERTVSGLGYDLVDVEKGASGLLRVFIDHPVPNGGASQTPFITVDDCEKVTRQLQHVLEVEGCSYERLEVSSPGLDRPLKKSADYARFVGEQIELTLKLPFKGRKKYRGELQPQVDVQAGPGAASWRIVLADEPADAKPTRAESRAARSAAVDGASVQALDFSLDEVREARLVAVVDFKGRGPKEPLRTESSPATSAGSNDEVDGGRIQ